MITRGIITYSDTDHIKVYVPILLGKVDKKNINTGELSERFQGLTVKSILTNPGIKNEYNIGDIVLVGFEDNEMSSVIILGYLGSAISKDTQLISLDIDNLKVRGSIDLSTSVTFGDDIVTFEELFNVLNGQITTKNIADGSVTKAKLSEQLLLLLDNLSQETGELSLTVQKLIPRVSSLYISADTTSPALIYGGTWEEITSGAFLKAVGSSGTAGSYDSSNSLTLSVNQLPAHSHRIATLDNGWSANATNFSNGDAKAFGGLENAGNVTYVSNANNGGAQLIEDTGSGAAIDKTPYNFGVHIWIRRA